VRGCVANCCKLLRAPQKFNELKNHGIDDVLIAVVDGLRGFPEAIEAVYPQAQIQTCIVHLIRNSTTLASWQHRKGLAAALKPVYIGVLLKTLPIGQKAKSPT
jgi:transposase-like protein